MYAITAKVSRLNEMAKMKAATSNMRKNIAYSRNLSRFILDCISCSEYSPHEYGIYLDVPPPL